MRLAEKQLTELSIIMFFAIQYQQKNCGGLINLLSLQLQMNGPERICWVFWVNSPLFPSVYLLARRGLNLWISFGDTEMSILDQHYFPQ